MPWDLSHSFWGLLFYAERGCLKAFLRGAVQWWLPWHPELICAITLGSSLALAWHLDSGRHEASAGVQPTHIHCWTPTGSCRGWEGKSHIGENAGSEQMVWGRQKWGLPLPCILTGSRRGYCVVALGKVHPHTALLLWHVCLLLMALSARPNTWTGGAGKKLHPLLMVWWRNCS